jgi:hypothetical protein
MADENPESNFTNFVIGNQVNMTAAATNYKNSSNEDIEGV